MSCKTCKGRGTIRRITPIDDQPRTHVEHLASGARDEMVPCPECQPQPFARAIPYDWRAPEGWGTHAVQFNTAEGDRLVWPGTKAYAEASAARLSRAVEQREAKLRGALETIRTTLVEAINSDQMLCRWCQSIDGEEHRPYCATLIATAALAGDGPDYVPATQLAAEKERVRQLQAAVDLLSEPTVGGTDRHLTEKVVRQYLEANGLKAPSTAFALKCYSDEQLISEMRQRNLLRYDYSPPQRDTFRTALQATTEEAIRQHENAVESAMVSMHGFGDGGGERMELAPGSLPPGVLRQTTLRIGDERLRVETVLRDGRISTATYRPPPPMVLTDVG